MSQRINNLTPGLNLSLAASSLHMMAANDNEINSDVLWKNALDFLRFLILIYRSMRFIYFIH